MFEIEYQSEYILIISHSDDEIYIICLDEYNTKIVKINTYFTGLENDMIEEAIKQVLYNGDYDIGYEIELYRKSKPISEHKRIQSGIKKYEEANLYNIPNMFISTIHNICIYKSTIKKYN